MFLIDWLVELYRIAVVVFVAFRPTQESQKIFKAQKAIDIEFVRSKVLIFWLKK